MNIAIAVENEVQMRKAGILAQALKGVSFENISILLSEETHDLVHLAHDSELEDLLKDEENGMLDLLIFLTPTAINTIKATSSRRAIYFGGTIKNEIVLHRSDICFTSDAESAEKLKNFGSENVHVSGPLEDETLPQHPDESVVNQIFSKFRYPLHKSSGLASLRMAEIIKHTLSPEPGT